MSVISHLHNIITCNRYNKSLTYTELENSKWLSMVEVLYYGKLFWSSSYNDYIQVTKFLLTFFVISDSGVIHIDEIFTLVFLFCFSFPIRYFNSVGQYHSRFVTYNCIGQWSPKTGFGPGKSMVWPQNYFCPPYKSLLHRLHTMHENMLKTNLKIFILFPHKPKV